jgi:hypothetical protein
VAFWEAWNGHRFKGSGAYAIDGALAPVSIELEKGIGRYVEPNVWFGYAA